MYFSFFSAILRRGWRKLFVYWYMYLLYWTIYCTFHMVFDIDAVLILLRYRLHPFLIFWMGQATVMCLQCISSLCIFINEKCLLNETLYVMCLKKSLNSFAIWIYIRCTHSWEKSSLHIHVVPKLKFVFDISFNFSRSLQLPGQDFL